MSTSVEINERLADIADDLDIPDEYRAEVEQLYKVITQHLGSPSSEVNEHSPDLYPQGSFRIGTVVKPLGRKGEIDVDIVCSLDFAKTDTTKVELKKLVGKELAKLKYDGLTIESCGRCWRLNIGKNLHVDVLPAIPNEEALPTGILLTDKDLHHWQKSNPKAYADWFLAQSRRGVGLNAVELVKAEVEKFPVAEIKTELQMSVQLLKRHRDVYFKTQPELRPPSILITTLAALSNSAQSGVFEKLGTFAQNAWQFIEEDNGFYSLPNPVQPEENFVDKWNTFPERRIAFGDWHKALRSDLAEIERTSSIDKIEHVFETESLLEEDRFVPSSRTIQALGVGLVPTAGPTSHAETPRWPVANAAYKAKIAGTVHLINKGMRIAPLSSRPIPINKSIKFWVETNVRRPYEVYWQVINTGQDAARVEGGLRGNIELDKPGSIRWETTSYRGTHYVVAHIVKNGVLQVSTPRAVIRIT